MSPTSTQIAIAVSELFAVVLIWRLLKSDEHPFFKVALSLLALIPFLGPLLVLWLGNFPSSLPPALRDQYRYSTDVLDRWRSVFNEKNPHTKFRKWKETISSTDNQNDFGP
jgi:hypothetical protein